MLKNGQKYLKNLELRFNTAIFFKVYLAIFQLYSWKVKRFNNSWNKLPGLFYVIFTCEAANREMKITKSLDLNISKES